MMWVPRLLARPPAPVRRLLLLAALGAALVWGWQRWTGDRRAVSADPNRLRSPTFLLAQAHLYQEPSVPVQLQTADNAIEEVGTHEVAGRPLEVCRRLVPAGEELLEDPESLR